MTEAFESVMPIDLDVLRKAYGWTVDYTGQVCGLVAGDMGYDGTGIVIPMEHLLALILKDHERVEDQPGYRAGFEAAVEAAAMLHAVEAHNRRMAGDIGVATHTEWAGRMWRLLETRDLKP